MLLDKIIWPCEDEDSDDEDFDMDSACRVTGYLRTFIESGKEHYLDNGIIIA